LIRSNHTASLLADGRVLITGGYNNSIGFLDEVEYYSINQPPAATKPQLSGSVTVGQTITGTYNYSDPENDLEGATIYTWYRADNADGTGRVQVSSTNRSITPSPSYTTVIADAGQYIFLEVTPKAITGETSGSDVLSEPFGPIALEKVKAPTSNAAAGQVASGTEITLSTTTEGASIYYTLNGSDPTADSTLYTRAIVISANTTIRAIAIKDGMTNSDVAEFSYTIAGTDECFIATAAFGSKFDWPVALLRAFRDQYLLTNPWGQVFVSFYYQNSPPIAAFIANSEPLKALVRVMLAPIIAAVYLLYHPAAMAILLIIAAITGYILRIRRKIKTA
jgi:hypothetical protein